MAFLNLENLYILTQTQGSFTTNNENLMKEDDNKLILYKNYKIIMVTQLFLILLKKC